MTAPPPPALATGVLPGCRRERDGHREAEQLSAASSLRQNVRRARQAALEQCCAAARPCSSATFCTERRRRKRDSTSGRVLPPCRPHSGLWRPAGVWRISCTAAPLFVGRTIFCAQCGCRAPMYALDGRPRSAPGCYVPLTRARLKQPG